VEQGEICPSMEANQQFPDEPVRICQQQTLLLANYTVPFKSFGSVRYFKSVRLHLFD